MSYRDPLIAVVRVSSGGSLGATICKIGIWLDQQKIQPEELTIAIDGKGYRFTISFLSFDDADRFRAQFSQADVLRHQAWGSESSPAPSLYGGSRAF
jgi:hypothetical protein